MWVLVALGLFFCIKLNNPLPDWPSRVVTKKGRKKNPCNWWPRTRRPLILMTPIISLPGSVKKDHGGIKKKCLWFSKTSQKTCKNVPLRKHRRHWFDFFFPTTTSIRWMQQEMFSSAEHTCSDLLNPQLSKLTRIPLKVAFMDLFFFFLFQSRSGWGRACLYFVYSVFRLGIRIMFKCINKVNWAVRFVNSPGVCVPGTGFGRSSLWNQPSSLLLSPLPHLQC